MDILFLFFCVSFTVNAVVCVHDPPCNQPFMPGNCSSRVFPKFYYDSNKETCEVGAVSTCPENNNAFDIYEECASRCFNDFVFNCSEPMKPGKICQRDSFLRWYYNEVNDTCESFQYTGCEGNTNRFITPEECDLFCRNPLRLGINCDLPREEGDCPGSFKKWYFDQDVGCREFNYTGCGGNTNRFDSMQSCHVKCEKKNGKIRPVSCKMEMDQGMNVSTANVSEAITMYYFNVELMMCMEFTYFGDGGNQNKFESLDLCEETCPKDYITMDNDDSESGSPPKKTDDDNHANNIFLCSYLLAVVSFLYICLP